MAPFPFSFWASYEEPPSPTPNPTPTPTPFACKVYRAECSSPGTCGSGIITYNRCSDGLSDTTSYTGAQIDAGILLPCARNYPNPPRKTSGFGTINYTIYQSC
jgi:hypothetical protein